MDEGQRFFYSIFAITIIIYCSVFLINICKQLWKNKICAQYFIYLLFYFFFIVPIISQLIFPNYEYLIFWRANVAMRSLIPNFIYLIFVFTFIYCLKKSTRRVRIAKLRHRNQTLIINICSWIVVGALVFSIINTGPMIILGGYGYAYLNNDVVDLNEWVIGCGILSFLVVLGFRKEVSSFRIIFLGFIVFLFFWIVGKRYIVAETLIMSISVLGMTGSISGKKMLKYLIGAGIFIIGVGFAYGILFKENVTSFIDYLNVDFSRQYTLVYQFYCSMNGRNISINDFDGITYLLTFFVPRTLWPDKPYPFVNYLTLSLVGQDNVEFTNAGWATTCSIFSDLYDSLSFLGIALGIWLIMKLIKQINDSTSVPFRVLLIYITVKLLTVQISSSIIQISIMAIIILIFTNRSTRKIRYPLYDN